MTHVREAVEQIRGTAVNQVDGAEVALVTGGPAALPVSGTLCLRARMRDDDRHDEPTPTVARHPGRVPVDPHASARRRVDAAVLGRRREDRLVVPRCTNCGTFRLPPPPFCFVCQHQRGRVGRAARARAPSTASPSCVTRWRGCCTTSVPYASGIVELDGTQGAGRAHDRATSSTATSTPLAIGDRVEIVWEHVSDDMSVPRFRPVRT